MMGFCQLVLTLKKFSEKLHMKRYPVLSRVSIPMRIVSVNEFIDKK
jgi:hypothetical protein